jgi:hypothetical protein
MLILACIYGQMIPAASQSAWAQKKADTAQSRETTYCNPMDLPYRFSIGAKIPYREAADPTGLFFHGEYWLFPSKTGGYYHSKDLLHWTFVEAHGYDVEKYAPAVVVMDDKLYLTTVETTKIYVADDPASGNWTLAGDMGQAYGDPDLFLDDDGRLYMYSGLSNRGPLRVTELDKKTFQEISHQDVPQQRSPETRGWEVPGNNNELTTRSPWLEGTWMTKHDGTYYLQFAGPGTEFKTYGDGVLTSKSAMGPFTWADYSPFSFKPTGFIAGAGHSSTFAGPDGLWWHVSSMTISKRHDFERRLGLFPTHFDSDGQLVTDTYLGDYPHYIGGNRGLVGWMLLSRKKPVTASSSLEGHAPEMADDEDVRTWWSAKTGDAGEWLQMDLGAVKTIEALQINFADEGATQSGRSTDVYRYVIEVSSDSKAWRTVVDHEKEGRDAPDDYEVLPRAVRARYVRIRNVHSPNGAKFSLLGLRVFGQGSVTVPQRVVGVEAKRDANDARRAKISWKPSARAEFYIVRGGTNAKELNLDYQVYDGATTLTVPALNAGVPYFVTVDAVNEGGIAAGVAPVRVQ